MSVTHAASPLAARFLRARLATPRMSRRRALDKEAAMWGQLWGQMLWGRATPVPAIGFWGALLLGAVLGALGVRLLRGARPRTLGALALGLALIIPISARAITLISFTNGTIADANQVNANFAALTPVSGFNEMVSLPAIGAQSDILSPTFVAPRAMTCTVTVETSVLVPASPPGGTVFVRAIKNENGVISYASAPPQNGAVGVGMSLTAGGGNGYNQVQTRQFPVSAGATVSFGSRIFANGDFVNATNLFCVLVYNCI
jgi:hypothetical protein